MNEFLSSEDDEKVMPSYTQPAHTFTFHPCPLLLYLDTAYMHITLPFPNGTKMLFKSIKDILPLSSFLLFFSL